MKKYVFLPLMGALLLSIGLFIGNRLSTQNKEGFNKNARSGSKIENLLQYLASEYVDTLNTAKIEDKAIENILAQLDPHSVYIPKQESTIANDELEGSFSGVGIEFNIMQDTVTVVSPISGGPAEQVGILPGDKIIEINAKLFSGTSISNELVFKTLRGKIGTLVTVGIQRQGYKKLLPFNITRDKIPVKSVDAIFMIKPNVGLIKINKFAATTHKEFVEAFNVLKKQGLSSLILDLRGNAGGFLNEAVSLCDEFLPNQKQIVYTKGKARPKENYNATAGGLFEEGKLIVLIDEGSASASEIVAGAIQDNDRGQIIGRRSFGKGLVQERVPFNDGAEMRLTIARYYTPSGRCIQKPYELGNKEDYFESEIKRFKKGEYNNADSVALNKKETYKTLSGKTVYGGGGIMPDKFISIDTSSVEKEFVQAIIKGNAQKHCLSFANKNRLRIKELGVDGFLKADLSQELIKGYLSSVKIENMKTESKSKLLVYLQANVLRLVFNQNEFFKHLYSNDKIALEAIKSIL